MSELTKKIAVVINARAESKRIPYKMTVPFAGKSLFQICIEKLTQSKVFTPVDIWVCYNELEGGHSFRQILNNLPKIDFNVIERTKESTEEENDQEKIYEFYKAVQKRADYCVLINPCCPLLSIETIDAFYSTFKYSDKDGLFGVIKKQNYFWDHERKPINLPGHGGIMNTKDPNCKVYEAAHCLYGSKLSLIPEKRWMGGFTQAGPELFMIPENEAFDIDYQWQFNQGEILYKKLNNIE